jgi:hypothetical protein
MTQADHGMVVVLSIRINNIVHTSLPAQRLTSRLLACSRSQQIASPSSLKEKTLTSSFIQSKKLPFNPFFFNA